MSPRCPTCGRPTGICVCDRTVPLPARTRVLVLQHPEEDDAVLGTAGLLAASLPDCRVVRGVRWGSFGAALGEDGAAPADWAVLWSAQLPSGAAAPTGPATLLDRAGRRATGPVTGVVVLDGTWSQAKSLWWGNSWLLGLQRVVLQPTEPGIYGRVRQEPNRQALSTLEAVAEALVLNGDPPETRAALRKLMRTMVQRARDTDPRRPKPGPARPA
jgi:DTW domain-containing protein YfiP